MTIVDLAPTLTALIRHAELLGVEQVYETAESYLGESELVQLQLALIEIERRQHDKSGRRFTGKPRKPKRLSRTQRLRAVSYLEQEGVPKTRIAKHLGCSVAHVQKLARELRAAPPETHRETPRSDLGVVIRGTPSRAATPSNLPAREAA